jgi:phenylalanyl-tRNA synthetase beta chain
VLVEFGPVHSTLTKQFDLNEPVYFADFNWDALMLLIKKSHTQYSEVPKYPSVRRDLALVVDKNIDYLDLETLAYNTERGLVKEINLFDVYEGDKIPQGKKSYALSFILQDETKTLNDKQIDKIMEKLIANFEKNMNAVIRK